MKSGGAVIGWNENLRTLGPPWAHDWTALGYSIVQVQLTMVNGGKSVSMACQTVKLTCYYYGLSQCVIIFLSPCSPFPWLGRVSERREELHD